MGGAWVMYSTYADFPEGSIHIVAVGDPKEVETDCIAMTWNKHHFIGFNNGLLGLLTQSLTAPQKEFTPPCQILPVPSKLLATQSPQLAKEILAPAAIQLAQGKALHGPEASLKRYKWAAPFSDTNGIQGLVLHIDSYGNLITNISVELFERVCASHNFKIFVGNSIIRQYQQHHSIIEDQEAYATVEGNGLLLIGVKGAHAAELLSVRKGTAVSVVLEASKPN